MSDQRKCAYCGNPDRLTVISPGRYECGECGRAMTDRDIQIWSGQPFPKYEDIVFNPERYEMTPELIECLMDDNAMPDTAAEQAVSRNAWESRMAWDWWDGKVASNPGKYGRRLMEWRSRERVY